MQRRLSMILAALLLFAAIPLAAAQPVKAADYSNIRVLLSVGSNVTSFGMAVNGSYFIQENGASFKGGTLTASYSGGKVVLNHSSSGQIYSGSSVNIMREKIDPSAGYIRATVGGVTRNYLGHFMIKASGSGLRVVNTVPLPHYLYGVVRGEMGNSFPLEALKAQAIAAKSYVLSGLTPSSDYDIGDTAADQVYKGYDASESLVISAVNATYDIGLYLGSNILRAYYAASNGGSTLLPSDVWSGTERYVWDKAYARVNDPYDTSNPLTPQETILLAYNGDSGMSSSVSSKLRTAITNALLSGGYINQSISVKQINQISKVEKTSTYNAYITLVITLSNGQQSSLRCGVDMRTLMSSAQRNSMRLFIVTETGSGFQIFQGRYGHGVGMSQRGAEQMANQGMKYDKILSFYYPGATMKSMGITPPQDPVKPGGSSASSEIIATALTTGNVNLRKGASTSTSSLGTVPKGVTLNVYARENGFCLTSYNGKTGYVSETLVKLTPVSNDTAQLPSGDSSIPGDSTALGAGAKGKVTSDTYLRSQSTGSGSVVAMLRAGVELDLLSESGNYYYAYVQGYQGYALKSDINVTNPGSSSSSSDAASGSYTATGETTGNVNFRKGPGTNNAAIKMLPKGTKLNIYSKANGWYFVNVNGTDGYVSSTYVKETGSQSASSPSSTSTSAKTVTAYGETTGAVNFRKGAGTSFAIIKMLSKGTKFDIYSRTGSWYHVNVAGTEGYLHSSFVKETGKASDTPASSSSSSASAQGYSAVVINDWVWLRSSPEVKADNSNTLRQCPIGTSLTVYSQNGNFYKVNVAGQDGYIHKDYVQITGTN